MENPSDITDANVEADSKNSADTGNAEVSENNEALSQTQDVNSESKENVGEEAEDGDDDASKAVPDEEWEKNLLFVSGMPPGEAGSLKQLLNTTLGADCHRIKPRIRGDMNLYVLFKSHDQMKVAESLLHNQKFLKYNLTAKVVDGPLPKKRSLFREKRDGPPPKKQKPELVGQFFLEGKYDEQIVLKTEDAEARLRKVAKLVHGSYPKYAGLIYQRQQKYDGLICELGDFKRCPEGEPFATRCKFAIGVDEETGQPLVGIRVPKKKGEEIVAKGVFVKDISKVNHNYPPHVIAAAKVFEKAVQASEKAPGICKFWHELIIRTNHAQQLMFLVFVQCKQATAEDEIKQLNEELKEFFQNGEGKEIPVVALYTKAICTDGEKAQPQNSTMELVMGTPHLEEVVMGYKLNLLPMMYFWNTVHAAKMVCEAVEELLAPTKETAVLEIGCGIGLLGFHMSKLAGQVLSVDVDHLIEEAKKNAETNKVEGIEHFTGKAEDMIPEMAKKITCENASAIVISSVNRLSTSPKAMDELRKIKQLKQIVLVSEIQTSRFSPVISLARTTSDKKYGLPFFPVKAVPVDTMPHTRSFVLLVLLERVSSMPKKPAPNSRLRMPYSSRKFDKSRFRRRDRDRRPEGGNYRYSRQDRFRPYGRGYEEPNVYEMHLQQMLEQERRRRIEEENRSRWLQQKQMRREASRNNNPVTELITDSLKEAGVPQLNPDAAQKLKQVIAEAIKTAGVLDSDSGNSYGYGGYVSWEQQPKPPTQPLLGLGPSHMQQNDYIGFGAQDGPGQGGSMYGRPAWNPRNAVQYPPANTSQYKPSYGPNSSFGSSGSQRGGYRNNNPAPKRYFS